MTAAYLNQNLQKKKRDEKNVPADIKKQLNNKKELVREAHTNFKENFSNFYKFKNFVFKSSISKDDSDKLKIVKKPEIETNILEAFVSRQRGEFSKQEPSIEVRESDDGGQVGAAEMQIVEGYMRSVLADAKKNNVEYQVYTDILSGGFSVMEVRTKYADSMGFHQNICLERVYDPTLTGFDPMAVEPHKGDGNYCYKLFPMRKEDFKSKYPKVSVEKIEFSRKLESFDLQWAYNDNKNDVVLLCDLYEKKKSYPTIVELSDGKVMTKKEYEDFMEEFNSEIRMEAAPIIVEERETEIDTICRYRLIEDQIIEYVETDFKYLPLIFVDGNSVMLRNDAGGAMQQLTRPYVYHAIGNQRFMNFALQTWANELENMLQTKLKVAKESLPTEHPAYLKAYTNPQEASLYIYNAYINNDIEKPLPPPMEVQRVPMPPEVSQAFISAPNTMQFILGAYDPIAGTNQKDVSGVAIVQSQLQTNAAAMPFVVGFLQGLNQAAQIIVDLIPKYVVKPRKIPVISKEGKKSYVPVNQEGAPMLNYTSNSLHVNVEAGASFAVQKDRALDKITSMSNAMPIFGEFINTMCLPEVLDNMEMRGIDTMKEKAEKFQEMKEDQMKQAQQAAQQQAQNNPLAQRNQIEMKKVEKKAQQDDKENKIEAANLEVKQFAAETDRMEVMIQAKMAQLEAVMQKARIQSEDMRKAIDLAISVSHEHHTQHSEHRKHDRDDAALVHEIKQANKPQPEKKQNA